MNCPTSTQTKSKIVIAVDGPSASGKSTVSRGVARALGFLYVDTGAMYRALTWRALQDQVDYESADRLAEWVKTVNLSTHPEKGAVTLQVNGQKIEDAWLRTPQINTTVSWLAQVSAIRTVAVAAQRHLRELDSLVAEGRDMGTVVFPDADFKFYVDVPEAIRSARRAAQGVDDAIAERDRMDSTRTAAPLKKAEDAILIENIGSPQETIDKMLAIIRADVNRDDTVRQKSA